MRSKKFRLFRWSTTVNFKSIFCNFERSTKPAIFFRSLLKWISFFLFFQKGIRVFLPGEVHVVFHSIAKEKGKQILQDLTARQPLGSLCLTTTTLVPRCFWRARQRNSSPRKGATHHWAPPSPPPYIHVVGKQGASGITATTASCVTWLWWLVKNVCRGSTRTQRQAFCPLWIQRPSVRLRARGTPTWHWSGRSPLFLISD